MLNTLTATLLTLCVAQGNSNKFVEVESVAISFSEDVSISFEEAGRISDVNVEVGQDVGQGELIGRLSSDIVKLEEERARIAVESAKHELESDVDLKLQQKALVLAKDELQRAVESVEKYPQSVSATEISRLRFSVEEAELRIEQFEFLRKTKQLDLEMKQAEHSISLANMRLRELRSPFSGTLVALDFQKGEWIQQADVFARIVKLDRLLAEGFVKDLDTLIQRGHAVEVIMTASDGEEQIYPGKLTFVDPEINSITGQVRVRAEIANPDRTLRPGHLPRMRILIDRPPEDSETTSVSILKSEVNGAGQAK